jgi:hypothetical protein
LNINDLGDVTGDVTRLAEVAHQVVGRRDLVEPSADGEAATRPPDYPNEEEEDNRPLPRRAKYADFVPEPEPQPTIPLGVSDRDANALASMVRKYGREVVAEALKVVALPRGGRPSSGDEPRLERMFLALLLKGWAEESDARFRPRAALKELFEWTFPADAKATPEEKAARKQKLAAFVKPKPKHCGTRGRSKPRHCGKLASKHPRLLTPIRPAALSYGQSTSGRRSRNAWSISRMSLLIFGSAMTAQTPRRWRGRDASIPSCLMPTRGPDQFCVVGLQPTTLYPPLATTAAGRAAGRSRR